MKVAGPLVIVLFLLVSIQSFAQSKQFDFLFGTAEKSGTAVGFAVKNLYKGWGLYLHTDGFPKTIPSIITGSGSDADTTIVLGPVTTKINMGCHLELHTICPKFLTKKIWG